MLPFIRRRTCKRHRELLVAQSLDVNDVLELSRVEEKVRRDVGQRIFQVGIPFHDHGRDLGEVVEVF